MFYRLRGFLSNSSSSGCIIARLGDFYRIGSKTITFNNDYKCPKVIDKSNWLTVIGSLGDTFGWPNGWENYVFYVDQQGNKMTVTTFSATDYKVDLKFICCKGKLIR